MPVIFRAYPKTSRSRREEEAVWVIPRRRSNAEIGAFGWALSLFLLSLISPLTWSQELKVQDLQGKTFEDQSLSSEAQPLSPEQIEKLKTQMGSQPTESNSELSPDQQKQMLELLNDLKGVQESMKERNQQLEKLYNE